MEFGSVSVLDLFSTLFPFLCGEHSEMRNVVMNLCWLP
jgi:hypothetical protein